LPLAEWFPGKFSGKKFFDLRTSTFAAPKANKFQELKVGGRKILLFIDNCPSHPRELFFPNIEVQFLPKNTTALSQVHFFVEKPLFLNL
jgi:hypothetical protein